MKVLIEPVRLERMLKSALFYKSKPMIVSVAGKFDKNGLRFQSSGYNILAFIALYKKSYFLEYQAEEEVVPFTETLLEKLKWGFGDEKITFETKDGKIYIAGKKDKYHEEPDSVEIEELPMPFENTDFGILPKGDPPVRVKVNSDDLRVPKADKYKLEATEEFISITIKNTGEFTKKVEFLEVDKVEPYTIGFDGDYLPRIFDNVTGEVWITLAKGGIAVSQLDKTHAWTFLCAPLAD